MGRFALGGKHDWKGKGFWSVTVPRMQTQLCLSSAGCRGAGDRPPLTLLSRDTSTCHLSSGIVTRNKLLRSARPITSLLLQHQERMVLSPSILILTQNRFSTDVGKRELTRRDPLYL